MGCFYISHRLIQKKLIPLVFILPAFIVFLVFSWYPIILGLVMSFQRIYPDGHGEFIGLKNFMNLLSDPLFLIAWKNTFKFVFWSLIISFFIPVVVSILLNEIRRYRSFFRLAIYLPVMLPGVAIFVLWTWLYHPEQGLFNILLGFLHIEPQGWLQNQTLVIPSLVFMSAWAGFGGASLLYLSALQGIPEEWYEAAEMDGASISQRLWHVTLPSIRPLMLILLLLQIMGTTQVFGEPFVMTKGGPNNASLTILLLLYRYAFQYFDFGIATAGSLILFIFLIICTVIYTRVVRKYAQIT